MAGIQDILGSVLGGSGGSAGGADITKLIEPIMNMIQQNGGLQAILGQLQNSPIGDQVSSWIGSGANDSVSGDNVADALGSNTVENLAQQSGLSVDEVKGGLSELLPGLIDKFTPGGQVPGVDQIGDVLKNIPGSEQIQGQLGNLLGSILGGGNK